MYGSPLLLVWYRHNVLFTYMQSSPLSVVQVYCAVYIHVVHTSQCGTGVLCCLHTRSPHLLVWYRCTVLFTYMYSSPHLLVWHRCTLLFTYTQSTPLSMVQLYCAVYIHEVHTSQCGTGVLCCLHTSSLYLLVWYRGTVLFTYTQSTPLSVVQVYCAVYIHEVHTSQCGIGVLCCLYTCSLYLLVWYRCTVLFTQTQSTPLRDAPLEM